MMSSAWLAFTKTEETPLLSTPEFQSIAKKYAAK